MTQTEIISLVANLSALTVVGIIYAAYIKNLRSVNELSEAQRKVAEKNEKTWKDRVFELERRTPEFVEKQLNDRIKIREDELARIAKDAENYEEEASKKNQQLELLKENLSKAHQYRESMTVWDSDEQDFKEIEHSDLEQKHIGSVCVDAACLMICDPYYVKGAYLAETEEYPVQDKKYRVVETGEYFCTDSEKENISSELLGIDDHHTVEKMLQFGMIEKVEYDRSLPAIPTSYIRGKVHDTAYKAIRHLSFPNGSLGAGIEVSLLGDGVYPVYVESYKGAIQRIIVDL